ncbi:MAG: OmpA family protein, partial [Acetobacteraceae bacterium]|nr:OmpA family protein [Acetobacteraceae bacterium]
MPMSPCGGGKAALAAALSLCAALLAAGCAGQRQQTAQTDAAAALEAPIPPKEALPLDRAAVALADAVLLRAQLPPAPSGRHALVIDPLIERATGAETEATRAAERRVVTLVRERHPRFELRPFTTASLDQKPLILLGSMAPVAEAGSRANPPGPGRPAAYRIWAVLADLGTGRVLAHEEAWVRADEVNPTPVAFYRQSPVWTPDGAAAAYLRTCALNPGDAVDPAYLQAVRVQALVADGVRAYEGRRYREALDLYRQAGAIAPPDHQLRIRNGLYLANHALGRGRDAEEAFASVVDYGLGRGRLAVKFVFRPGSTAFWPDPAISGPYPMWLRQIAARTDERGACLEVEGHSSPTGSAAVNERLSLARAERVRARLVAQRPDLRDRLEAEGVGSREAIVGTGADDASDVLDRRVEFEPR